MKSFLLQLTFIKEESLFSYIFWKAEISHFVDAAYFSIVAQGRFYESKNPLHFFDVTSDFEYDVFAYRNRVAVSHGKVGSLSGGL